MKILHIVPFYAPALHYGGVVAGVHALNKALHAADADVTVYTTNLDGPARLRVPLGTPVETDGVRVFYFEPSRPYSWGYSRGLHRALARTVRDFDAVHISSVYLAASALGAKYSRSNSVPYVMSPHGSLMRIPLTQNRLKFLKKRAYLALIERSNLAGAAAIHFASDAEKADYLRAGFPAKRTAVIPNPVEPPAAGAPGGTFREKFGIPAGIPAALFLGRLAPIKGLDTLIPSWKLVLKNVPEALLLIAGNDEGAYGAAVRGMAGAAGISGSVRFTGVLGAADKWAALRESDLLTLPSYSENFGIAAAEAMAAGTPVVVTPGVGIAGLIQSSGAGLVVKKEPAELAAAMERILKDKTAAGLMGEKGRALAAREFSPAAVARRFLEVYNSLI